MAGQIVKSAIIQKTSCGAHFRADAEKTMQTDNPAAKMDFAAEYISGNFFVKQGYKNKVSPI